MPVPPPDMLSNYPAALVVHSEPLTSDRVRTASGTRVTGSS